MGIKLWLFPLMLGILLMPARLPAQELERVELLPPQFQGGMPLMQALKERKTMRDFSSRALEPQMLSDLLWAAAGINRPETGHRTAPTARNRQEIDVYVAKADGLFLYNAADHALESVLGRDIRSLTGLQDFVKDAPVNLIFIADLFGE